MTNLEIYSLYDALQTLSNDNENKLPVKVGFICLKNRNLLEPYYNAINDLRTQIVEKYAIIEENGSYRVPDDKIKIANEELDQVLEMEEETNIPLQKISIQDIEESTLPVGILDGLFPIIEE